VERNYLSLWNRIIGGLKTERSGERLLLVISAAMSLTFRRLLPDRAASSERQAQHRVFVARSQWWIEWPGQTPSLPNSWFCNRFTRRPWRPAGPICLAL